jgi:hypothetical protein
MRDSFISFQMSGIKPYPPLIDPVTNTVRTGTPIGWTIRSGPIYRSDVRNDPAYQRATVRDHPPDDVEIPAYMSTYTPRPTRTEGGVWNPIFKRWDKRELTNEDIDAGFREQPTRRNRCPDWRGGAEADRMHGIKGRTEAQRKAMLKAEEDYAKAKKRWKEQRMDRVDRQHLKKQLWTGLVTYQSLPFAGPELDLWQQKHIAKDKAIALRGYNFKKWYHSFDPPHLRKPPAVKVAPRPPPAKKRQKKGYKPKPSTRHKPSPDVESDTPIYFDSTDDDGDD